MSFILLICPECAVLSYTNDRLGEVMENRSEIYGMLYRKLYENNVPVVFDSSSVSKNVQNEFKYLLEM